MSAPSIFRNPWVWAFFIGIVTLTAIRPLLRRVPEPPPVLFQLPEYSLVASDGRPFGSAELRGQVYIASFFFTSCRSICPPLMHGVKQLQEGLARNEVQGIKLVSISVTPEQDTPSVLTDYGKTLGVDPARWILLTGDEQRVKEIVVGGFKTPIDPVPQGGAEPMDIAHSGKLVLVDGLGRVRGYYDSSEMGLDEVFNRAQHVLRQ